MLLAASDHALLVSVHGRLGFRFLLESLHVTIPELQRALNGQDVRAETAERVRSWVSERLELVERKTDPVTSFSVDPPILGPCPTCGRS